MSLQKFLNSFLGKIFSFQILVEASAYPNLDYLILEGEDL